MFSFTSEETWLEGVLRIGAIHFPLLLRLRSQHCTCVDIAARVVSADLKSELAPRFARSLQCGHDIVLSAGIKRASRVIIRH